MSTRRTFVFLVILCAAVLAILNYNSTWIMYSRKITPTYFSALELYIKYNGYLNDTGGNFPEHLKEFLPPIDKEQQEQIRDVFFASTELLNQLGIPYLLTQGTLLGSYLYHNMVPWDEDLDVLIHFEHVETIKAAFENNSIVTVNNIGLKFKALGIGLLKIYLVTERHFTDEFRNPYWPFLDIFPCQDNGTHLLQIQKPSHVFPKDKIFPIQWRPFEGKLQPVPCNTLYILESIMFRRTWSNPCVSRSYNHLRRKGTLRKTVPCEEIRGYYPFVNRTILNNNKHVREIIKLNDNIVENSTFEIPMCDQFDGKDNETFIWL